MTLIHLGNERSNRRVLTETKEWRVEWDLMIATQKVKTMFLQISWFSWVALHSYIAVWVTMDSLRKMQLNQIVFFLFHAFIFLVKTSAYITHNATRPPTVRLEIRVYYASSS